MKVLLKTSPFAPNDQTLGAGTKSGGRIAIGPDGFLYVTIGDRDNAGPHPWPVAQYLDTHLGKVIRITKEGAPAPGNPSSARRVRCRRSGRWGSVARKDSPCARWKIV